MGKVLEEGPQRGQAIARHEVSIINLDSAVQQAAGERKDRKEKGFYGAKASKGLPPLGEASWEPVSAHASVLWVVCSRFLPIQLAFHRFNERQSPATSHHGRVSGEVNPVRAQMRFALPSCRVSSAVRTSLRPT